MTTSPLVAGAARSLVVAVIAGLMAGASLAVEHHSQAEQRARTLSILSKEVSPSPEHPPERVVAIQLEALRLNDDANRGIELAFRFASPANKRVTGPLPKFAFMIRHGPYRLMLDYQTAVYDPVLVVDRRARQRVTLLTKMGAVSYVFHLSRQTDGTCRDCWMTDAVTVEPFDAQQV